MPSASYHPAPGPIIVAAHLGRCSAVPTPLPYPFVARIVLPCAIRNTASIWTLSR